VIEIGKDKNVTYYPGCIETNVVIRCEKLERYQKLHQKNNYSVPIDKIDTFIVDSNVLPKIEKLLETKSLAADYNEDARMFVTIKHKNGEEDYLCINQQPSHTKCNGAACSFDNELFFLLRYYSGYYNWFDSTDLQRLEELQDTVFYQKALEQTNH
jgi:hypothetical protein